MLSASLICEIYWEDQGAPGMSGNSSNSFKRSNRELPSFNKIGSIPRRLKEGCVPWKSTFFSSRKLFALEKWQSKMQTKTLYEEHSSG